MIPKDVFSACQGEQNGDGKQENKRKRQENKKREQGSRTPNVVFYKCNHNKLITIVKGDFWGRKAFFECLPAGVAGEERPASRHGGQAEGGRYKCKKEGRRADC